MAEILELESPPSDVQEQAFLDAWKFGVLLSRQLSWFGVNSAEDVEKRHHKQRLQPHMDAIRKGLRNLPASRATLIASMVMFYNPAEGLALAEKLGCASLGDLSSKLNHKQRQCVSGLLINYQGW